MHASSEAVPITRTFPYTGDYSFGKRVSEDICAPFADGTGLSLCGLDQPASISNATPEGFRTFSNSSTDNRVVLTDDQHAIIVPAAFPSDFNVTYAAKTVGVHSTCER